MTMSFDWDATLALVRWQHTRRGCDSDTIFLQTGISLLQSDADVQFGPQSALVRTERAYNLPWHRIVSEVLQFAVFVLTKGKRDDEERLEQTRQALQLLQLALNALAVNGDAQETTLPLNSCDLLLSALAETLEKTRQDEKTLETLKDVKAVLLYLFGLPNDVRKAVMATFLMYRPSRNVFTDFLKRTFNAAFASLMELQKSTFREEKMELETLYVDVMHASLFVFRDLQKTQTNKKKVFLAIAKTSLRDFVTFRHSLMTLQKRGVTGVEATTALLDHVIQDALFGTEHICQFDGAAVHASIWKTEAGSKGEALEKLDDKKVKKRRKAGEAKAASGLVSYQKNLFDELFRLLSDQDMELELKASIGAFFELLVRGFATRIRAAANTKIEDTKTDLKTSRKRAAIVIATTSTMYSPFKFWSELCAVAYSCFQQEARKSDFLPVLVTLYNALFRVLCECDIYRVTEDTEERTQFMTMEKIISSFLQVLEVEHGVETIANAYQVIEECEIVSSAVQCSPNLVNDCLVPIFELLGRRAEQNDPANKSVNGKTGVIVAASRAVIELIHAHESMRLLDAFLKGAFAIQQAHAGLYKLFAIPLCETALRKAFMALPPGQIDVLWKLLVEQIASFAVRDDDIRNVHGIAVARLLFQTFVHEIHVVPQNRAKVLGLVLHTHEQLFSSFVNELSHVTGPFTFYQRELFCVFGELLVFDSVLSASIRAQTFDQMFNKLEGNRFCTAMEQLLSISRSCIKAEDSISNAKDKKTDRSTIHGTDAAGVIKLCVFWLRKTRVSNETQGDNAREGRERVTRLIIEYVVNWKCWEAVSFHLPELMMNASSNECDYFFREILSDYIREAVSGQLDGPAMRIVCDAGFYEISSLRNIASDPLTTLAKRFVDEVQHESSMSLELPRRFFCYLLEIPSGYLKPQECGRLLATALALYHSICVSPDHADSKAEVCQSLLAWIQQHFKVVGVELHKLRKPLPKIEEQLRSGASFIVSQLAEDKSVSVALVTEVLGHYLDIGADAFAGELLNSIWHSKNASGKHEHKITRNLKRAVIVVQALAAHRTTLNTSKEEKQFIEDVVEIITQTKVLETKHAPLSFDVLTALLKYQSVLHKLARQHKSQQTKVDEGRVSQVLLKHVGDALVASMKLIAAIDKSTDDMKLQNAARSFFVTFCEEYASFRTFVTPLQMYGYLLAVSLSLVSRSTTLLSSQKKAELAALQALIVHANKDEFRLLLFTLVQELAAHAGQRKLAALCALYVLLSGDRKLSASRRFLLNEHKDSIVDALLQNLAAQAMHIGALPSDSSDNAVSLRVWNLKVFVLVFSKAELFTWKNHELQHVFTGFQTIVSAVSCWQVAANTYQPQELHELWMLSYTLLLRVVRHHFGLVVNGISHLVEASNALLRMLVLASAHSEYSSFCSEWSSNLARLYGYMKEHDVQLRKHVVYLLMAFLVGVTRDKLAVRFQQQLRPGVFALLDVCSSYEKEQLFGALDSTGKSLLKTLDANYKLTHRYVGKV